MVESVFEIDSLQMYVHEWVSVCVCVCVCLDLGEEKSSFQQIKTNLVPYK